MEQTSISELNEELNQIDVDSIKLDAVIQLKTWQKKMHSLINKTYANRMHEIDSIVSNTANEIKEKQNQIKHCQKNDQEILVQLKNDVDLLKSNIVIVESIPEHFEQRIERTIRIARHIPDDEDDVFLGDDDDDDDEPVIVDIDRHEIQSGNRILVVATAPTPVSANHEGTVSKIFNSKPIQNAIATGITNTLINMGTIAATSTTTVAATTMAKTALIATACGVGTVAYGVGRIAIGTTKKVWSLVVASDE